MSLVRLGLPASATAEEAKAAYRRLAQTRHPDKGGTKESFQELLEWYHAALAEVGRDPVEVTPFSPDPCPNCQGTGKVSITQGWSTLKWPCSVCHGTGAAS